MASRPQPLSALPHLPGTLAAGLVLALVAGPLVAVAVWAGGGYGLGPADLAAIRFTVVQALVSATLSVACAIPVARALARRSFPGRGLLITLLGAPFLLPVIVAVFGLIAVFGRSGLLNAGLGALGLPEVSVYGFQGVVLAHVFFNLPLATRILLQGWLAVPAERFRLAATLNAPVGRLIEVPMLRATAPGAWLLIFLLCLTSFAVALTLGGGPRATTVELAIYQALRFDFAPGRAAVLGLVQVALCVAALLATVRVALPSAMGGGFDRAVTRFDAGGSATRWIDGAVIAAAAAFLLVPLAMVLLRGLPGLADLPASVWTAALRSLAVALASTALCLALALAIALRGGWAARLAGSLPLAVSALVLGTGLFLIVRPLVSPFAVALPVTVLVNALLALPFAVSLLAPAVQAAEAAHGRLASALGLTGVARLRIAVLPRLRRPLGLSGGLAAALSMGDLGVIVLFAGDRGETLPLAMYRLMGAYRMEAAAGAGLLLVMLTLALFWAFDRGGRGHAAV
jgi:thiamine transport system permease protein